MSRSALKQAAKKAFTTVYLVALAASFVWACWAMFKPFFT
jgi:hypothetical protein